MNAPYQYNFHIVQKHISQIRAGDIIVFYGKHVTVCHKDIRYSPDMDISIFGDCYHSGNKPVEVVIIETPKIPLAYCKG
jgi:ASC-1-like (ASCH) protein